MKRLVLIPTYREAENIVGLIARVRAAVTQADILVVDDASPDGTAEAARAVGDAKVRVLVREGPRGYGRAVREGLRLAVEEGYDQVATMDADGSHDPARLPDLFAALEEGDLSIGSRYVPGGSLDADWDLHRKALSRLGNLVYRLFLGPVACDLTSGFRAYRREILLRVPPDSVASEGYSFLMEYAVRIARAEGRIRETPIHFSDRTRGDSKMPAWEIPRALGTVLRLSLADRRPAGRVSRGAAAYLLLLAAYRFLHPALAARTPTDPGTDPYTYFTAIRRLLAGDLAAGISSWAPPLPPPVGAGLVRLTGLPPVEAYVAGTAFLSALAFLAFFSALLRRLPRGWWAWGFLAALLTLESVRLSKQIYTENVYMPLLWSMGAILLLPVRPYLGGFLLGLLGVLAMWARPPGLLAFAASALLWGGLVFHARGLRTAVGAVVLLLAVSYAALTPMLWYSQRFWREASWSSRNGGTMLYLSYNPEATGRFHYPTRPWIQEWASEKGLDWETGTYIEKDLWYRAYVKEWIRENPRDVLRLLWKRATMTLFGYDFDARSPLRAAGWAFFAAGLFAPVSCRVRFSALLLAGAHVAVCLGFLYQSRYLIPAEPFFRLLQALGIAVLLRAVLPDGKEGRSAEA